MKISPRQCRSLLVVCGVLAAAVGAVVAFGVIPPVRGATAPDITPDTAVAAFWVNVGLQLVASLILLFTAALSKGRSWFSTSCLVATGVVMLFLGFALGDAALAFREVGMQTVTTLLFICVAADVVAGVLAIATAFLRPKPVRD